METRYEEFFDVVNRTIFDDIFNYSDVTLRNNIKMTLLNNGKYIRGMLYSNVFTVMMPDAANSYYLFLVDNIHINNLLSYARDWVNLEDVLNDRKVNIDIVTENNRLIPKRLVYGRMDQTGTTMFAIDKKVYDVFGESTETYMVINVDSDVVGDRTVIGHIPITQVNINTILTQMAAEPNKQYLGFINGYYYKDELFKVSGNPLTDYYELYTDENVRFSFDVDLTHRNTYMSSEEHLYKDIIIIPKELGLEEVFTFDTISLIVMDDNGKGIYLPYLANESVSQLTHNSFGISSYLIDAAFDILGITTGILRIVVSDYSKNNVHTENGSLTKELYSLANNTYVMDAMKGLLDPDVNYWLADNLEKRTYGKFLTNIDGLSTFTPDKIKQQIECLGYYRFVTTLCRHNGEFTELGSSVSELTIPLPYYWQGVELFPILYLDGKKIRFDLYNFTQDESAVYIIFDLPITVDFSYSIIRYELIKMPLEKTYVCSVSEANDGIVIPKQNGTLRVFKKDTETVKDVTNSNHPGYVETANVSNTDYSVTRNDSDFIIQFNVSAFGSEYVFIFDNLNCIQSYLNVDISDGKTLHVIPINKINNSSDTRNILVSGEYDVYLNDRFLVHGIDYRVNRIHNANDKNIIGGYDIVIQNLKYLEPGGNRIDIIKTNRVNLSTDIGYVVDGIIPININNEAWVKGISRLFINGKAVPWDSVTRTNTHYVIDSRYWSNGYVYQFMNTVERDFYTDYESHMLQVYFEGREEVCRYFTQGYSQVYPDPIIIQYGNKIFSSYLNEIIRRIIANQITVNFINDDEDIVGQLVNYEYLKEFDVLFDENGKIDKRFIDIYPGYLATVSIDNLNHYLYIQRLVKIILGNDTITDYMVVYTGS